MTDVELNIHPLHTNNSQTDVPTSSNETGLASQIEQPQLRLDQFENRVSLDIVQLSNQINQLSTKHLQLTALVRFVSPPPPPHAQVPHEEF